MIRFPWYNVSSSCFVRVGSVIYEHPMRVSPYVFIPHRIDIVLVVVVFNTPWWVTILVSVVDIELWIFSCVLGVSKSVDSL